MIVVTGGAGFIGSNVVAELESTGAGPLAVVDRFGSDDKWKNLRGRTLEEIVDPDVLDAFLERRRRDVRHVVHMGAITSTDETDVDLLLENNVRLSQRLWRWCAEHGVPLIYASSAATYGDGSAGFDDDGSLEGLARLVPLNPYAWTKHAFDRWVARQVADSRPTPPQWAALKFFNVYGPNEYHKGEMRSVVTKSYASAAQGEPVTLFRSHHPDYEDGGQMRDFVYVGDVVDVLGFALDRPIERGIYNLGTGRARTFADLARATFAALGKPVDIEYVPTPEDIRERYQYFTEAKMAKLRAAGYTRPFTSLEDGVRAYVERLNAARAQVG
jgi:ADP-L-glycero-D-manno-heptose 6-epimerase